MLCGRSNSSDPTCTVIRVKFYTDHSALTLLNTRNRQPSAVHEKEESLLSQGEEPQAEQDEKGSPASQPRQ